MSSFYFDETITIFLHLLHFQFSSISTATQDRFWWSFRNKFAQINRLLWSTTTLLFNSIPVPAKCIIIEMSFAPPHSQSHSLTFPFTLWTNYIIIYWAVYCVGDNISFCPSFQFPIPIVSGPQDQLFCFCHPIHSRVSSSVCVVGFALIWQIHFFLGRWTIIKIQFLLFNGVVLCCPVSSLDRRRMEKRWPALTVLDSINQKPIRLVGWGSGAGLVFFRNPSWRQLRWTEHPSIHPANIVRERQ